MNFSTGTSRGERRYIFWYCTECGTLTEFLAKKHPVSVTQVDARDTPRHLVAVDPRSASLNRTQQGYIFVTF